MTEQVTKKKIEVKDAIRRFFPDYCLLLLAFMK